MQQLCAHLLQDLPLLNHKQPQVRHGQVALFIIVDPLHVFLYLRKDGLAKKAGEFFSEFFGIFKIFDLQ